MGTIGSKPVSALPALKTANNGYVSLLDRARQAAREGKPSSGYSPVSIKGEPLSETILRDRGSY